MLPLVCEIIGGVQRPPAWSQRDVVAYSELGEPVAVGMVVCEMMEVGGGLRHRSSIANILAVEEVFVTVGVVDACAEANVLVGVGNLDDSAGVDRAFPCVSVADALPQDAVDQRVAQVEA